MPGEQFEGTQPRRHSGDPAVPGDVHRYRHVHREVQVVGLAVGFIVVGQPQVVLARVRPDVGPGERAVAKHRFARLEIVVQLRLARGAQGDVGDGQLRRGGGPGLVPGFQDRARHDLAGGARGLPGARPAHGQVVAAAVLFVQHFDVVLLPGHKADRSRFLGRVLVPLQRAGPAGVVGDPHFVIRSVVGAQPQLHLVVAADPEGVRARGRRDQEAADALPVAVGPVAGLCRVGPVHRTQLAQGVHPGGRVGVVGVAGQIGDRGAPDVGPLFPGDGARGAAAPGGPRCRALAEGPSEDFLAGVIAAGAPGEAGPRLRRPEHIRQVDPEDGFLLGARDGVADGHLQHAGRVADAGAVHRFVFEVVHGLWQRFLQEGVPGVEAGGGCPEELEADGGFPAAAARAAVTQIASAEPTAVVPAFWRAKVKPSAGLPEP